MEKTACKACGFAGLRRFVSLGNIPPVNAFIEPSQVKDEKSYPLNLAYCPQCFLAQLEEIVPPDELFRNYLHLSAGSATNISHLQEVSSLISQKYNISPDAKILEIGSNDGTLLSFLKKYTPNVLGVDPAQNLISLNKEKEVDYVPEFFNTQTASEIKNKRGEYDFIIALNVIPHTPGVTELLKAVRICLKEKGMLIMEGVYALETILKGEFDTIYHEHVYTFSLHSLISTFRFAGLKIVDVEKIPTQGGSLRVYAMKEENAPAVSREVKDLLDQEKAIGLSQPEIYEEVNQKIQQFKTDLRKIINEEKIKNGRLIGLGAPARGVVISNYCKITGEDVEYVVDDTPLKQGRLMPGVHIPVKSFDSLKNEKGRTFILLSWNYKDHFISKLKELYQSFKVIIPFPKLQVMEYG